MTERSQALRRLEHQLDQLLPPELIGRVSVGNLRQGVLILFVESAGWAARLRFQVPQLLQKLSQKGRIQLEKIEIRVLPPRVAPQPPKRKAEMSEASAQALESMAKSLSDPGLADALARLSQRGRKNR